MQVGIFAELLVSEMADEFGRFGALAIRLFASAAAVHALQLLDALQTLWMLGFQIDSLLALDDQLSLGGRLAEIVFRHDRIRPAVFRIRIQYIQSHVAEIVHRTESVSCGQRLPVVIPMQNENYFNIYSTVSLCCIPFDPHFWIIDWQQTAFVVYCLSLFCFNGFLEVSSKVGDLHARQLFWSVLHYWSDMNL